MVDDQSIERVQGRIGMVEGGMGPDQKPADPAAAHKTSIIEPFIHSTIGSQQHKYTQSGCDKVRSTEERSARNRREFTMHSFNDLLHENKQTPRRVGELRTGLQH